MLLGVFGGSVILLLILTGFHPNVFCADDAILQQEPVINSAMNEFLSTGKMPYIDFYNNKGGFAFAEGIYGLYNPFMIISFVIAKYIFRMRIGALTAHIFLMTGLGSVCFFYLMQKLKISLKSNLLCIIACMGTASFAYYSYYYFIFNCYFFIPFLLLIMIESKKREKAFYIMPGIALAFSMLMGHTQYTVYFFGVYTLLMIVWMVLEHKLKVKALLSNIVIGILLILPHLYLAASAMENRDKIFGTDNQFMARSVHPLAMIRRFLTPIWVTDQVNNYGGWWVVEQYYDFTLSYIFLGILFPLLMFGTVYVGVAFFKSWKKKEVPLKNWSEESLFVISMGIGALFLMLLSFGEDGGIAFLFSKIPVINSFRYLYKITVLFIPLMVVPSAVVLDKLFLWFKVKKTKLMCVLLMTVVMGIDVVGLCNNYYINTSGINEYVQNNRYAYNDGTDYYSIVMTRIQELGLDTENYRFLSIVPGEDVSDFIETSSSEVYTYMTKNMSTAYHCFSIMGYFNSISDNLYMQSDTILKDITINGQFTNAMWSYGCLQNLAAMSADESEKQEFYNEIDENALKYFILNKNDSYSLEYLNTVMEQSDRYKVAAVEDFVGESVLVVIDGVNPLIHDENNNGYPLESAMSSLICDVSKEHGNELVVSMIYNKHLVAIYTDENGEKTNLKVSETGNHYIKIDIQDVKEGKICLLYKNKFCDFVLLVSFLIFLLTIAMVWRMENDNV